MFGEPEDFVSFDTTKIRIAGIKEMYKLASEKKSALSYLTTVLEDGLFVSTAAYIYAKEICSLLFDHRIGRWLICLD